MKGHKIVEEIVYHFLASVCKRKSFGLPLHTSIVDKTTGTPPNVSVASRVKGGCFVGLDTTSKPNGAAYLLGFDKPGSGVEEEEPWGGVVCSV